MKVRKIVHGARDSVYRGWSRKAMQRVHWAVRRFAARPENEQHRSRITLTFLLMAMHQERLLQRFFKQSRRRSYRKRMDRLWLRARVTGGKIVYDSRGIRVVRGT